MLTTLTNDQLSGDGRWKTSFGGRRPSVEDDLWWKTTVGGRHPLVADTLWWKMTFSESKLLIEGLL